MTKIFDNPAPGSLSVSRDREMAPGMANAPDFYRKPGFDDPRMAMMRRLLPGSY